MVNARLSPPTLAFNLFEMNRRDGLCLGVAVLLHSLLFLWQGGMMDWKSKKADLGEPLIRVEYVTETPTYEGLATPPKENKGFLSKMKKFFRAKPARATHLKMGKSEEIAKAKAAWDRVEGRLVNKEFKRANTFSALNAHKEMSVIQGRAKNPNVKVTQGTFEKVKPALNEKKFKMAQKDMPFKIVKPKRLENLANVNAVPVNVGKKTSPSIKGMVSGPVGMKLKSKGFSRASWKGEEAGFGGLSSPASRNVDGHLAGGGSVLGSGPGKASGGGGRLAKSARTSENAGWGRPGALGSSSLAALPRNTVSLADEPGVAKAKGRKSGFEISGALKGRGILKKVLPAYVMDARVALRFRVDWSGRVLDGIVVTISSGHPSFDNKVVRALKQWVFSALSAARANEIQEGLITFLFRGV